MKLDQLHWRNSLYWHNYTVAFTVAVIVKVALAPLDKVPIDQTPVPLVYVPVLGAVLLTNGSLLVAHPLHWFLSLHLVQHYLLLK
jgi:hypothetical protein